MHSSSLRNMSVLSLLTLISPRVEVCLMSGAKTLTQLGIVDTRLNIPGLDMAGCMWTLSQDPFLVEFVYL